jgi:lipopolysaccharide transport system ATP-binding protein
VSTLAVRGEHLAKTYRIRHPKAPTWRDYLAKPRRSLNVSRTLDVHALHDVSFEVDEGEVFGIIGRNGAGKSTLLKILSRITTPSSGRATIAGTFASLLEVGTGFHPELTGRENVYLNGTLLGMTSRDVDGVFEQICEFAGVSDYIDTPIKRYSSGMQLRLAFAVAAHLAADTMIIDEVLAVGDAEFQAKCTTAMRDAAGRGRTTLFVSHNMAAVENLCTRAMLLEKGCAVAIGPASEIVRSYLQRARIESGAGLEYSAGETHAPSAPVYIARASVSGAGGDAPVQGEELVLRVDLAARQSIGGVQLGVGISTIEGGRVATLCNGDYRQEWNLTPGLHRATVRVGSPHLLPRSFTVSLRLMRQWGAEVFDDVPDALTFTVQGRDVLGTGIALHADRGVSWFPAVYSLSSNGHHPSERQGAQS